MIYNYFYTSWLFNLLRFSLSVITISLLYLLVCKKFYPLDNQYPKGTYAPPAFNTAKIDTIISTLLSKHNAINVSGFSSSFVFCLYSALMYLASWFDLSFSSLCNLVLDLHKPTLCLLGFFLACSSNSS